MKAEILVYVLYEARYVHTYHYCSYRQSVILVFNKGEQKVNCPVCKLLYFISKYVKIVCKYDIFRGNVSKLKICENMISIYLQCVFYFDTNI